jgi:hypothetical protein
MNDAFEPRNVLEHKVLDAQEGRLTGELFMKQLLDTQVFVLVQETLKALTGAGVGSDGARGSGTPDVATG